MPSPRTLPTTLRLRGVAVALTATTAMLLAGCGGDDTATSSTGAPPGSDGAVGEVTVEMEQSRYLPDELTVAPGTTVEFVNTDPFAHTVTSADGAPLEFDSGELGQDETFERTFERPGSYSYFCEIHPTMRATVVVEAA